MTPVLSFQGVGKAYDMRWAGEVRTLRGVLSRRAAALRRSSERQRWALRDVTFELPVGRSLGLIGHNGAGKSTLLRLASGVGRPTTGTVYVHPRTASVLSLGSSFDAQLTGIENAYTAALIAGFSRRRARHAIDEIIEFSGLGEYAWAPVRTYSDGMMLRLAFSVATAERPQLLVLDEVLAVGDLEFSRRCEERIAAMQKQGTSVLLASHSLEEIEATCAEALWVHRGRIRDRGDAATVGNRYEAAMSQETLERTPVGAPDDEGPVLGRRRFGSQEMVFSRVEIRGSSRTAGNRPIVQSGGPLVVSFAIESRSGGIDEPVVGMTVRRTDDEAILISVNTSADQVLLGRDVKRRELELTIDRLDLPGGDYFIDVGLYESSWDHAYDYHYASYQLRVEGPEMTEGVLLPPRHWRLI
jgi:lipopolysaccharide transport system ATP-binding protein